MRRLCVEGPALRENTGKGEHGQGGARDGRKAREECRDARWRWRAMGGFLNAMGREGGMAWMEVAMVRNVHGKGREGPETVGRDGRERRGVERGLGARKTLDDVDER